VFAVLHIFFVLLFGIALIFVSVVPVFAAGWTQPEGTGVAIVQASFYTTEEFFTETSDEVAQPRFSQYQLNPYTEYGITDDWTIGSSVFLHYLEQETDTGIDTNYGVGALEVFGRYQLYRNAENAWSLEFFTKLPSSYAEAANPRAGRDEFDLGTAVGYGHSFSWLGEYHYWDTRLAYRHRFGRLTDQVEVMSRLGITLNERITLMPLVQAILPVSGISQLRSVSGQNDFRLYKLQFSALYEIMPDIGIEAGVFSHVAGENTGGGGGGLIGLWWQW
jgi:hypothetical protein